MKVLSLDPGVRHSGLALFDEAKLIWAGLVVAQTDVRDGLERLDHWVKMAVAIRNRVMYAINPSISLDLHIISEIPVVRKVSKGDPNDLIDLAGVVGAMGGVFAANAGVTIAWSPKPEEWKGQLPKHVTEQRVNATLSAYEQKQIIWPAKDLKHNVYDAIHLGLTFLKREGLRL